VFLVPDDIEYDEKVIRSYLNKKYDIPRDAREFITGKFNFETVIQVQGVKFVVCVRRPDEDGKLGDRYELIHVQRGSEMVPERREVPPERYEHEVYESKPILMSDHVKQERGQLFRPTKVDMRPIYDVLTLHAQPRCRVSPQNPPDFMCRMTWAG
jgi:hypothetical protein